MRLAFTLALALGLSFPAAGTASRRQDQAGSANASGQAPAAPAAQEATPPAEKKAPESAAKGKTDAASADTGSASAGPASGATKRSPRSTPAQGGALRKIVVRQGGANEPATQIVPGMTPAEVARERQSAEQWLQSTANELPRLADRPLDAQQQETVGQIRNYMNGARGALQEGDVSRARTLAEKAHLLADDLLKH